MAHKQVREELIALIKMIRREMYPLFKRLKGDERPYHVWAADTSRGGGMMRAHDICIKRLLMIIKNEEREYTEEEKDILSLVTSNDIIREYDKEYGGDK